MATGYGYTLIPTKPKVKNYLPKKHELNHFNHSRENIHPT